jgi:hypothetical protein
MYEMFTFKLKSLLLGFDSGKCSQEILHVEIWSAPKAVFFCFKTNTTGNPKGTLVLQFTCIYYQAYILFLMEINSIWFLLKDFEDDYDGEESVVLTRSSEKLSRVCDFVCTIILEDWERDNARRSEQVCITCITDSFDMQVKLIF